MGELKTLNEIKLNFQDRIELKEKYELWLKKKFLKEDYMNLIKFFQIELRKKDKEEAIKWLKEDKEVIERLHPEDVSTWTISINRWMKRFNISEKDLD